MKRWVLAGVLLAIFTRILFEPTITATTNMETLLNHIAITSTLWTTIVLTVFAFMAVAAVADEKFVFLNISAIIVLALVSPLFKQVTLATFSAGAVVYLLAGCAWVIFKWGRYAEALIIAYKEAEAAARDRRDSRAFALDRLQDEVNPANNKSRIFHWLFYWPFSVVDWCISDLWKAIYNQLSKILKAYTARLLAHHNIQAPPNQ